MLLLKFECISKLPIIEKEFALSLDNDTQNETVVLLSKGVVDKDNIEK